MRISPKRCQNKKGRLLTKKLVVFFDEVYASFFTTRYTSCLPPEFFYHKEQSLFTKTKGRTEIFFRYMNGFDQSNSLISVERAVVGRARGILMQIKLWLRSNNSNKVKFVNTRSRQSLRRTQTNFINSNMIISVC